MGAGASACVDAVRTRPPAENQNVNHGHPHDPNSFGFAVWQLKDGEDRVIADRLAEIFSAAPKA